MIMKSLKNPIKDLIKKYESEGKIIPIDQDLRDKEISRIDEELSKLNYKSTQTKGSKMSNTT